MDRERKLLAGLARSPPSLTVSNRAFCQRQEMTGFAATAMDWLNAYRRYALEPMIILYDDQATQACNCGGPKVIAGKDALLAYWIDQFLTYPVEGVVGLQPEEDGESLSFLTTKGVVRARLHMNERGKILRVECGLVQ